MPVMTKQRTSFALDGETISAIRRLSRIWGVSQAEVVRRAVKRAAEQTESEELSVRERLESYRAESPLTQRDTDQFLRDIDEDRERWRGRS